LNPPYENILVETQGRVGIVRLNRPQRMNALNDALAAELGVALGAFDSDPSIGAIVLIGNDKAFAAGADIGAMAEWDYQKVYADNYIMSWESVKQIRKPVIAAVAGYALGGGCELAMMCDIIIAADTAKFGQPEITIGTMPGMGRRRGRALGPGRADCSRRQAFRRSACGRHSNRRFFTARGAQDQRGDQPRLRVVALGRLAVRAARVSLDVCIGRPEGRHARVCRQTQTRFQAPMRPPP